MPQSISNQYKEVLTLALQLPPTERIAMIAELAVSVTESVASSADATAAEEAALSSDEVTDLMNVQPLSPVEIVEQGLLGSWSDLGISDGAKWVEQQKHRRKEARQWQMPLEIHQSSSICCVAMSLQNIDSRFLSLPAT